MVLPFCWPVGLKLSAPPSSLLALPTGGEGHCPQDPITKRVGALPVSATWEAAFTTEKKRPVRFLPSWLLEPGSGGTPGGQ